MKNHEGRSSVPVCNCPALLFSQSIRSCWEAAIFSSHGTSLFFGGKTSLDSEIIIGFAKKALQKRGGSHLIFLANLSMNRN
jgi:hypothetical protein